MNNDKIRETTSNTGDVKKIKPLYKIESSMLQIINRKH